MEAIVPKISRQMLLFFVGDTCPSFAEDYHRATANCSSVAPKVLIDDEDEAAIYYSSGTTGFPKAILLKHQALIQSARMEAIHHATTHEDVFLVHPAPVPHGRQDALVWFSVHWKPGSSAERQHATGYLRGRLL